MRDDLEQVNKAYREAHTPDEKEKVLAGPEGQERSRRGRVARSRVAARPCDRAVELQA